MKTYKCKIMNSNRHVHLNRSCLDAIYGPGYELTVKRPVDGPIFVANEKVTLTGPKGSIHNVTVLGPLRPYTQAEILRADRWLLGIEAPVALSGATGTAPFTISGPYGSLECPQGMQVAKRHLHISERDAAAWGLTERQAVKVWVGGERALVFEQVVAVFADMDEPTIHVDLEEGNAGWISNGDMVDVIVD